MRNRVLHIVPDLVPYGLERVVATLAEQGDRENYEVSIASLYGEVQGSLAAGLRQQGIRVFHLDKRRGLDPRMFYRIWRVLKEVQPDVVHTHNYVLRYVLPAALLVDVPVIVHTIHNVADHEVDRAGEWLQNLTFDRYVQPVVIADEAANSFERVYGRPSPPLIRNGIAVSRYAAAGASRDAWRKREGFDASDLLFVCVARFYPQKNHKTLIEAFASGPARLQNAKLLLAGDGHLRDEVEAQVQSLGIADRVHFLGRRDDIPELLGACDVFALASLWEGNPLSVMEAMAAGLPCCVTAAGGVPELVANGKQGFVVKPGDAEALSFAMQRLAVNSALRGELGTAAAHRAEAEFDHKQMVEAYESLYDELLSGTAEGYPNYCTVRKSPVA